MNNTELLQNINDYLQNNISEDIMVDELNYLQNEPLNYFNSNNILKNIELITNIIPQLIEKNVYNEQPYTYSRLEMISQGFNEYIKTNDNNHKYFYYNLFEYEIILDNDITLVKNNKMFTITEFYDMTSTDKQTLRTFLKVTHNALLDINDKIEEAIELIQTHIKWIN